MPYGTPKILNSDIKKQLMDTFEELLNQQGDIFQGSQAYYGFTALIGIELNVIARGDQKINVKKTIVGGEIPAEKEDGEVKQPPQTVKAVGKTSVQKGVSKNDAQQKEAKA